MESIINLVLLFLVYYKVTLDYWGSVLKQEVNNNYWVCNKLFHHMMCVYIMRAYIFGKKANLQSSTLILFFPGTATKSKSEPFSMGFSHLLFPVSLSSSGGVRCFYQSQH